jgi:hypothetical protein
MMSELEDRVQERIKEYQGDLLPWYHEVAHAVMAYHQGWEIRLVAANDELWLTRYRGKVGIGTEDQWMEALLSLTGYLAETYFVYGEFRPKRWLYVLHSALQRVAERLTHAALQAYVTSRASLSDETVCTHHACGSTTLKPAVWERREEENKDDEYEDDKYPSDNLQVLDALEKWASNPLSGRTTWNK